MRTLQRTMRLGKKSGELRVVDDGFAKPRRMEDGFPRDLLRDLAHEVDRGVKRAVDEAALVVRSAVVKLVRADEGDGAGRRVMLPAAMEEGLASFQDGGERIGLVGVPRIGMATEARPQAIEPEPRHAPEHGAVTRRLQRRIEHHPGSYQHRVTVPRARSPRLGQKCAGRGPGCVS